jgi:arylsulfatase A-like enzyme
MDLAPSILELAHVEVPKDARFDGTSMAATLLGKEQAVRSSPIFFRRPPDRPGTTRNPFPDLAMREGDWKLLCMADGSLAQLYDLSKDERESENLAGANPERVEAMKKALLAWNESMPKDKPQTPREPAE